MAHLPPDHGPARSQNIFHAGSWHERIGSNCLDCRGLAIFRKSLNIISPRCKTQGTFLLLDAPMLALWIGPAAALVVGTSVLTLVPANSRCVCRLPATFLCWSIHCSSKHHCRLRCVKTGAGLRLLKQQSRPLSSFSTMHQRCGIGAPSSTRPWSILDILGPSF